MAYNTETFINKVKEIHGNKYDYSKVDYKKCNQKVCIICPEHGEFYQTPMLHIQGCGCPICGKIKSAESQKQTKQEWINKAIKIYGNKYDYSEVEYNGCNNDVRVICPIHGEFMANPTNHIAKHQHQECPKCNEEKNKLKNLNNFISQSIKLYGNKYDLTKINYINNNTNISIYCKIHGNFLITPKNFIKYGCPICYKEKKLIEEKSKFISLAKEKFNNKYNYSKINYKGKNKPITIICPIHGEFKQTPKKHLNSNGCYTCWKNKNLWTYEKCYNIAKNYKFKIDFKLNNKKAYNKAVRENWIKDFNWLIDSNSKNNQNKKSIYVYEFTDKAAYIGITNWIEHRDYQHRWNKSKSSVYEYSINNNIKIPPVKILEENVNLNNAGNAENKWIKYYYDNGWNVINKVKGGALGTNKGKNYTKETILKETKQYKNQEEVYKNNRPLYNAMRKFKLVKECFPKTKFKPKEEKQYEYTENFLNEIVKKYPKKSDLRKNENRVYHWLYKHNRLYDFYKKD